MTTINWAAVSAIAEVLGVIAVVVSVIYLAAQIRAGSQALSTTVRDSVYASLDQWNYQITADPAFAWMFHRGLQDFNSLDEKERPRFMHTIYGFYKVFENIYLHYLEGSFKENVWAYTREIVLAYSSLPGAQYYLRARAATFDPRFLDELRGHGTANIATPDVVAKGAPAEDSSSQSGGSEP